MSSLNLVNCVSLGSNEYLKIDTTVKCYQIWQWAVYAYIILFIVPFWMTLLLGPGVLRFGLISIESFILGILFPAPFLVYICTVLYKERKYKCTHLCHTITTDGILDEVWYSYKPFSSYHYLCWGGLVELRRLTLVIFATLISEPVAKVTLMTLVIYLAFLAHLKFHPYLDNTANACANISLCATLIVGMINFGWATLLYIGSGFQYGNAWEKAQSIATIEMGLVEMVPVGVVLFCCGKILWSNLYDREK